MTGTSQEKDYVQAANELTQAFKDIERGEQAAAVLESNLSSLESKIDDLLKNAGEDGKILGLPSENKEDQKDQKADEATSSSTKTGNGEPCQ